MEKLEKLSKENGELTQENENLKGKVKENKNKIERLESEGKIIQKQSIILKIKIMKIVKNKRNIKILNYLN